MKNALSYGELRSKVEEINKRQYDYEPPFLDVVDQILDDSEGKHVKNVLVEAFEKLLSQVNVEIDKIENEINISSSCKSGCTHCCFFPVIMTRLEAKLMILYINQLPEERKQKVIEQVSSYVENYSSEINDIKQINFKEDDSFKLKYKKLGIPCVFLDQQTKRCTVYEIRPIPCRTYVNYVDVSVCSNEHLPKEPLNFEFMQRFYIQGMDEVIQEILEVVEARSLGFSYPSDAEEVNYLPILLQEELEANLK
ncbi:YkgJ family cysteine cluster protein [Alkalihalobacillus deserti]|uniref:YkgJ family cysteine cluster protein n=1 Tax=Alkalihalobacillus deserti TaxID=2879466 RepID=UPI001D1478B2|nr:YkgJ family cysteine cluster protein [Alkalihalobacillus deserti]